MSKYKNISPVEVELAGIGVVQPGETVEVEDSNFNNANFQLVNKTSSAKKVDEDDES